MLFEIIFFLLPVAAASGWYAARRDRVHTNKPTFKNEIPPDYLKGLNYLINEQPDKAIEVFIQLLEVDNETVETHLALGSLFRRRGEVDRSIRIHQNLIARPTLTPQQRAQALFELGQDYLRAGLFDRAETLFAELVDTGPHTEPALWYLIDIYQQEKDWDKAIFTARRLEARTGKDLKPTIAQYYCELAEQAYHQGDVSQVLKLLKRAISADRQCVRASLLQGEVELSSNNYRDALKAFKRVEQQNPEFLSEMMHPLVETYRKLERMDEGIEYLQHIVTQHDSISVMLTLADLIVERQGEKAAVDFLTDCLRRRASVRAMDRLIELNLDNPNEEVRDKLQVLKDVTEQLLLNRPLYKCQSCGFSGKTLHWQCPSCREWNTVKPIHGLEGE